MKRLSMITAVAMLACPAAAADLPLKANPIAISNTYPTTGLYFGVWGMGAATSVQASGLPGVNTAGLNAFGGGIGGTVGYVWGSADGARFVRVNVDAGWQNINGQSSGISFGGPATIQLGAEAGVPFAQIAAFLPSGILPNFPGLPTPPAGVTYGPPHVYFGPFADFQDVSFNFGLSQNTEWQIAPGLRIGMLTPTSNGLMIDAKFEYVFESQGTCFGPAICAKQGNTARFKVGVEF